MSWLKGLAGKAEDFLNQIDQNAAVVLQPSTDVVENGETLTEVTWDLQESEVLPKPMSKSDEPVIRCRPNDLDVAHYTCPVTLQSSGHSSTSSGMHTIRSSPNMQMLSSTSVLSSTGTIKNDNHLIEFLNSPPGSSLVLKKATGTRLVLAPSMTTAQSLKDVNNPKHVCRPVTPLMNEEFYNSMSDETSLSNLLENSKSSRQEYPMEKKTLGTAFANMELYEEDALKTENELLHNELRSFNNEMSLLLQRSKAAEKECNTLQQQLADLEVTNNYCNQIIKDKEQQASHLEEELQMVRHELLCAQDNSHDFQQKITKLDHESTNVSGAQRDALLAYRQKLSKRDDELECLKSFYQQQLITLNDSIQCMKSEKASLSQQVNKYQLSLEECQKATNEWQEKFNKSEVEVLDVRSELEQYRARAQRILQDKDKLISELRGVNISKPVDDITALELEQLRLEKELVTEEAIQVSARLQATRMELAEAEGKFETYKVQVAEAQIRLQETLEEERKRRQAAEEDCKTHSEGLHSVREELTRQRSLLASKLREREAELAKLRSQLLHQPVSPQGDELESRLYTLTQTLVQKQSSLEAITTERNAIRLHLEKMEIKHRATMAHLYQNQGTTNVNDTDDAKARVPSFLEESPSDTGVARRVKRVYSNLDAVSIRTGVFLRRYPLARILVLCYVVLLHVWVMIVLFTYTPEIHPTLSRSSKGSR